jgi:O-antigen ligase
MMKILVGLSVVLAAVAVVQTAFPGLSNAAFNWLGFSKFMAVIGSPHEKLVVRSRGIAGADFSRSSSLFLADLGLAFFQVLIIPFAAALYFTARKRGAQIGYGFFLVLMIGVLATTITRSAVLAAGVGLAFVTVHVSGYAKAWPIAAALALLTLPVIVFAHLTPDSIGALFSTKEGSASAHLSLLQTALAQFREHPWGIGLGNGSHVANLVAKFGVTLPVSAAESWYLQIALEMGIIAVALFTLMLLAAIVKAVLASFYVTDPLLKVITIGVAGAGVSLAVSGIFQPVWAGVHVSYLFWLFAGIAARAVTLERQWAADTPPAEFTRTN